MCGISCVFHEGSPSIPDSSSLERDLQKSLDKIKHRGPDAQDTWISPNGKVALGHVRLSINDLAPTGNQPLHDDEQNVHVVVIGELYDYDILRKEMEEKCSYPFQGRSDSELALALYRHYGISFLSHLRGEFAICLYDGRTETFIAARDRYGIKPILWMRDRHGPGNGNRLLIASEAKAFMPFGWEPEWDVRSILDGGFHHDERTMFKGVTALRPGHYMMVHNDGYMRIFPYWEIDYQSKWSTETRTEEEMINGVREQLVDAVRARLRADVPVGVYLSGGLDSSSVAGIVSHLLNNGERAGNAHKLCTLSIAFAKDSGLDESEIAARTSEWLGATHYKKYMDETELARYFESAVYHSEQYLCDFGFVGKHALSELARDIGLKVVLTGEGSDEHFGGYPNLALDYVREQDSSWAGNCLSEKDRAEQHRELMRSHQDTQNRGHVGGVDKTAHRILNGLATAEYLSIMNFHPPYAKEGVKSLGSCDALLTIAHNVDGRIRDLMRDQWHPLHSGQYLMSKGHLANMLLTCYGDRTDMAHSLESRLPFLDHRLTEYVNHLPPSIKIKWDPSKRSLIEKWILREACRPFITREIYERKKHGYSAPVTWKPDSPLHQLFSRLITKENVEKLGFIYWEKVQFLVRDAFEEKDGFALRATISIAGLVVLSQSFHVKRADY